MSKHHRTERHAGRQNLKNNDEALQVINFNNSHQSRLFIDSNDAIDGLIEKRLYSNPGKLIRQDTCQIGIKKVVMDYNIPNSNALNNNFKFQLSNQGATVFEVTMPIDYFATIDLYMVALAELMKNSQTFTDFSYANGLLVSSSTTFTWIPCCGISNNSLHGLFHFEGFTLSQKVTGNLLYTRYLDILISRVKDAQLNVNCYSENKPFDNKEHLSRVYIPLGAGQGVLNRIELDYVNPDFFPYRKRQLTQFEITIYDEYGNLVYTETTEIDGSFYEIKYMSYNIELVLVS